MLALVRPFVTLLEGHISAVSAPICTKFGLGVGVVGAFFCGGWSGCWRGRMLAGVGGACVGAGGCWQGWVLAGGAGFGAGRCWRGPMLALV